MLLITVRKSFVHCFRAMFWCACWALFRARIAWSKIYSCNEGCVFQVFFSGQTLKSIFRNCKLWYQPESALGVHPTHSGLKIPHKQISHFKTLFLLFDGLAIRQWILCVKPFMADSALVGFRVFVNGLHVCFQASEKTEHLGTLVTFKGVLSFREWLGHDESDYSCF